VKVGAADSPDPKAGKDCAELAPKSKPFAGCGTIDGCFSFDAFTAALACFKACRNPALLFIGGGSDSTVVLVNNCCGCIDTTSFNLRGPGALGVLKENVWDGFLAASVSTPPSSCFRFGVSEEGTPNWNVLGLLVDVNDPNPPVVEFWVEEVVVDVTGVVLIKLKGVLALPNPVPDEVPLPNAPVDPPNGFPLENELLLENALVVVVGAENMPETAAVVEVGPGDDLKTGWNFISGFGLSSGFL
jgi:hypothetical protein